MARHSDLTLNYNNLGIYFFTLSLRRLMVDSSIGLQLSATFYQSFIYDANVSK